MPIQTKDWIGVLGAAFFGATIIAGLSSGEHGFWVAFVYALIGLTTIAASMIGTFLLMVPHKSHDDARLIIGGLTGFFVTTPLALSLVFYLLDKVLPW